MGFQVFFFKNLVPKPKLLSHSTSAIVLHETSHTYTVREYSLGVARGATVLRYGTGRYCTIQYGRILEWSRTVGVRYGRAWYGTIRYSRERCGTVGNGTVQYVAFTP